MQLKGTFIPIIVVVIILQSIIFSPYSVMAKNSMKTLDYNKLTISNTMDTNEKTVQNTTFSIVVTQSFLADFVQNIVGDLFKVTSIVTGTEDPHSFSPKPSDITTINAANVFVVFGVEDIDGWAEPIISSPPPTLHVLTLVNLTEDGTFDPFIGSTGALNPHLWMSPIFVNNTLIQRIYDGLVQIDPTHQEIYSTNLISYRTKLGGLIERVQANATKLSGLEVIEYHAAFFYLLRDMNITRLGTIEQIEDQEPSALHIVQITQKINQELDKGKEIILIQPMNLANSTTWQLARDTGIKISYMTALMGTYPSIAFTSYIQMIDYDLIALNNPSEAPNALTPGFEIFTVIIPLILLAGVFYIKFSKKDV
ncbi:MAG: metal ABC transporter substrate-binding protein [Candidatus Thorarchaeota archaeon]